MLNRVATALIIALILLGSLACDRSPDGYTVEEIKALPVSSLVVPDGEVIRTIDRPGTTYGGPNSTHIIVDVRSDLSSDEVFAFYQAELAKLGWSLTKRASQDWPLNAVGFQGDFGFELRVFDRAVASDDSDWGNRRTVYRVIVAAAGRKGE